MLHRQRKLYYTLIGAVLVYVIVMTMPNYRRKSAKAINYDYYTRMTTDYDEDQAEEEFCGCIKSSKQKRIDFEAQSTCSSKATNRGRGQKVISYSFFGNLNPADSEYLSIFAKVIKLASRNTLTMITFHILGSARYGDRSAKVLWRGLDHQSLSRHRMG